MNDLVDVVEENLAFQVFYTQQEEALEVVKEVVQEMDDLVFLLDLCLYKQEVAVFSSLGLLAVAFLVILFYHLHEGDLPPPVTDF